MQLLGEFASAQTTTAKPKKLRPYVDPLVIPPVLTPDKTTYPGVDYYEISVVQGTTHKFHRDLPATVTHSFFSTAPAPGFHYLGPTIIAKKGTPVKVKFTNKLPLGPHVLSNVMDYTIMGNTDEMMNPWTDEHRVSIHLHGGKVSVLSDGGPRNWFSPVGSSQANPYPEAAGATTIGTHTYDYPNDQPACLLWYHDHAWGITRFNPFMGQAAAYVLRDDDENALIANGALPSGAYEVPIVLQDRLLDLDTGAQIYPPTETPGTHPIWIPEYFGDTPIINGKAFPYLEVEPRRYRLRFLNGTQARFFSLWLLGANGNHPMWVIGSEQGFLPAPANVKKLVIGPGERYDTIVDFSGVPDGSFLVLRNNAKAPFPGGQGGQVAALMHFKVVKPLSGTDASTPPASLTLPTIPAQPATPSKPWREIVLSEVMDPVTDSPLQAHLDGQDFLESAPPNPPLFTETDGAVSVWQFVNTTGDAHPMHTHLAPFKVLNRQRFDDVGFLAVWDEWLAAGKPPATRPSVDDFLLGNASPPDPAETGWKDTARAMPGEVLRIITQFVLPAGTPSGLHRYVCHCHILEHEENDMMFYYGVQKP